MGVEQAKNELETFVYDVRSKLSEVEDLEVCEPIAAVGACVPHLFVRAHKAFATETELSTLKDGMTEAEEWLYGDGANAKVAASGRRLTC